MKRILAVAVLVVAFAGCGDDDDGNGRSAGAADALEEIIRFNMKGQHGRAWEVLHPAQQEIVSKDAYLACAEAAEVDGAITGMDVEETYEESVGVPGTDLRDVESLAITARYEATVRGEDLEATDTSHLFLVNGEWRWALTEEEVEDCRP